jgi:tRNA A-37 threonylcarbamoyl transferase component Bud32
VSGPSPQHSPLDIERHDQLVAYLRNTGRIGPAESPQVRTLAGGVSNRTVWLQRETGEAWVLKQALAKLRVQVDWFSDPSRVHREALGLRWLEKLAPQGTITPLVFEDRERHLLAMEAVPEPHENWKTMLLRGDIDPGHVDQFAEILRSVFVHSPRYRELPGVFADRSFFESLRLEPYYQYTAAHVPEARDFLNRLVADTRAVGVSVVHGDYSPKNVLVRDGKLVLLDHEVIHWGDPAFDVGFAVTHFLSKAHHLPQFRGTFIEGARRFVAALPPGVTGARGARHTLACMLARVAGRSPLEYLDDAGRARQRRIIVDLMSSPPTSVLHLINRFAEELHAD